MTRIQELSGEFRAAAAAGRIEDAALGARRVLWACRRELARLRPSAATRALAWLRLADDPAQSARRHLEAVQDAVIASVETDVALRTAYFGSHSVDDDDNDDDDVADEQASPASADVQAIERGIEQVSGLYNTVLDVLAVSDRHVGRIEDAVAGSTDRVSAAEAAVRRRYGVYDESGPCDAVAETALVAFAVTSILFLLFFFFLA